MCGGLSKNGLHRLVYLNAQSSREFNCLKGLGEGLRGVLLEEVCLWGWVLRFQKPMSGCMYVSVCLSVMSSLSACCLWLRIQNTQLLLQDRCLHATMLPASETRASPHLNVSLCKRCLSLSQ